MDRTAATDRTVLVVEDDEGLNRLLCRRLKQADIEASGVQTGTEALACVEKRPDVLLLLDYLLPDTDARRFVLEMRRRGRTVPFIIMTGHGDEHIAVEMMKLGARDYLTKQVDFIDLLVEVVKRVRRELQTEAALKESEERLQTLLYRVPGVVLYQTGGGVEYMSENVADVLGYPAREFTGDRDLFPRLIHPDDRTAVDAAYEQWVRAKCPGIHAAEFRVRRKDGEYVWLRDQTRLAFVTPDGRHSAIGVLVDVTERKQAERTLRESEARFRGLFENSGSCVAVYEATANGADFVFRDFNQAAERAERTSREDILGRSVLEVFPGVREFGLFEVLQRVWRTGTPERHPVSWYEDNRIAGWRDNYVYRLPSGDVVAVYEDATERKLAEQALRDAAAQWQTTFDGINDAVCILTPQGGDSALQPHDGPTAGPDAGIARRPAMPLRGPRHDGAAGRLPACPGPEFACPRAVRDRNRRPDGRSDR